MDEGGGAHSNTEVAHISVGGPVCTFTDHRLVLNIDNVHGCSIRPSAGGQEGYIARNVGCTV